MAPFWTTLSDSITVSESFCRSPVIRVKVAVCVVLSIASLVFGPELHHKYVRSRSLIEA